MDLGQLDTVKASNSGAVMQVRHPTTGAVIDGVTVTLLGIDSDAYREREAITADKRLQKILKRSGNKLSTSEMREDTLNMLVACTVGWEGVVLDGAPLPFNPANARKLYQRVPWLREQVEEFVGDRANFLGNS